MWAIPTGVSWLLKKNQVKSPSSESRVLETGSDPPIGSDRDSGCDNNTLQNSTQHNPETHLQLKQNSFYPHLGFSPTSK